MTESTGRRRGKRTGRANGEATRRRVLEVSTTMFAAAGFEATSLRQISAAASIDIATLKYHFGDKANLFANVYQMGHEAFIKRLTPLLDDILDINTPKQAQALVHQLAAMACDFTASHRDFVRLVLYRIMEDASDITDLEDELQGIAISLLEDSFAKLIDRGLIRPVDVRALNILLIASIPMWFVTAQVKPAWIGPPLPDTPEGRPRAEAFLRDLLERLLLP